MITRLHRSVDERASGSPVSVVMRIGFHNLRQTIVTGALVALGAMAGCADTADPVQPKAVAPVPTRGEQPVVATAVVDKDEPAGTPTPVERIDFQDGQGKPFVVLERGGAGSRLLDGQGQELARYSPPAKGRVAVRDADNMVVGWIVIRDDRLQVRAVDGATIRFRFQRRENGNWKLEDGQDNLICKINRRVDGWEVKNPSGERMARVRKSENATTVSDGMGKTLASTTADIDGLVVACLEMGGVESLPLRGGVMLAVMNSFGSRQETR